MQALSQMQLEVRALIEHLVNNAKQLLEISAQEIDPQEIARLQDEQELLIQKLAQASDGLEKSASPFWKEAEASLRQFEELNGSFISNLQVRKGLIQFDLDKIQESRHSLSNLHSSYGSKEEPKSRIDTHS
ncbi:MAG: hypothetical protein K0S07_1201 [Chlamydiales bacterium]|jgi:hypothetical protein|nr:hypothetical protein [Chlamydiales bacterium]